MSVFKVFYNPTNKWVRIREEGTSDLTAPYVLAGSFDHGGVDDTDGWEGNHVFFHHVRDVLYHVDVLDMNAVDLKSVALIGDKSIVFSDSVIAESASIGTVVSSMSILNGSGAYIYTKTEDADAKFLVEGATIKLAAALNYEDKTSHSVTIQADGSGGPIIRTHTFDVTDVAEPVIQITSQIIAESASVGATVGVLSVTGGSGSYTFTETADPDSKFVVSGANLNLSAALNYEAATSHSVTIQAAGTGGPVSRTFTINVSNAIEGTLAPLTSSVNTDDPDGTELFTVTGLDVGANESVSSISPNDGRFAIAAGNKIVKGITAVAEGTVTLTVTTSAGRILTNTITVVDALVPAMAALSDIPGLVIDFDGSDSSSMVLAGNLVTEWNNKGSYGGKALGNGSYRPTFGTRTMGTLPTLDFTGTNHMDVSSECFPITAAPYSMFHVWDNDTNAVAAFLHLGQNALAGSIRTGLQVDVGNVDNRIYQYSGATSISDPNAPESGGPTITQLRGTVGTAYNYINGITRGGASGTPTYGAMGVWRIGGDPDNISSRWNGTISEIVGYNRVLTLDEGALVLGFLAWKWGLESYIAGEWATKDPRTNPRVLNIVAFGDSFTELAYLTNPAEKWTNILATRLNRLVANLGIGGQTSTAVTDRSITGVNYTDRAHIFFCGTNGADSGHTVLGDIQLAVEDLAPGTKFLILPSFNTENEPEGSGAYDGKMANNAAVAAAFPDNYLDIRSMLVALSAPGQEFADSAAYNGDYVCDALRYFNGSSTDSLHLGANGVAIMADMIGDWIEAEGW